MYNVLIIEREYGAGGSVIAARLAQHLGWKLYDTELTAEIARVAKVDPRAVAQCDEHCDPLLYRLAKVFWRGSYEPMLEIPEGRVFDTDTLVSVAQRLITEAGQRGRCVIVGRGAPYILRQRNDRFSVFLFAPRELKISRAMAQHKSQEEATRLVDTIDAERAAFVKRYFGKDWPCRDLYDMMLNTDCGYDLAVELILQAMAVKAQHRVGVAS